MQSLTRQAAAENRRHQRVKVSLLGRFMLPDRQEYPCQTVDMSPGGVALISPVPAEVGMRVVCYLDHIGRVEGKVARKTATGFAVEISATARKRDKLATQLTWLANRDILQLPEDRRHERLTPENPLSQLALPDGRILPCRIIDVSLSGAAVALNIRPPVGSPITLGSVRGQVVRHFHEGIAIEFAIVFKDIELVNRRLATQGEAGAA
jgi:hypothetical protein